MYLIVPRDGDPEMVVRLWNHIPDAERISIIENISFGGDDHSDLVARVVERLVAYRRIGTIGVVPYTDAAAFGPERWSISTPTTSPFAWSRPRRR